MTRTNDEKERGNIWFCGTLKIICMCRRQTELSGRGGVSAKTTATDCARQLPDDLHEHMGKHFSTTKDTWRTPEGTERRIHNDHNERYNNSASSSQCERGCSQAYCILSYSLEDLLVMTMHCQFCVKLIVSPKATYLLEYSKERRTENSKRKWQKYAFILQHFRAYLCVYAAAAGPTNTWICAFDQTVMYFVPCKASLLLQAKANLRAAFECAVLLQWMNCMAPVLCTAGISVF